MAHRQLSSLVRRIRRPVHHPSLQPLHANLPIEEDVCFNKFGRRLFSKSSAHRKPAGKITNVSQNVVSSHGQSSASQARENQSETIVSQALEDQSKSNASQVLEDQSKSHGSSEQSSFNKVLILGAGTALVIGLYAFFPWDLLKSYYVGEKKKVDLWLKDSKDVLSSKAKQESEEEKPVLEGAALVEDQEHENVDLKLKLEKETNAQESIDIQTEFLKNDTEGTGHPNKIKLVASNNASSSPIIDKKNFAVNFKDQKVSEVEAKDANFHLVVPDNDNLSREDLSPASFSNDTKNKLPLANYKSRDDTVVPISQMAADHVSGKESISMETPSRSPMRRPNILEAYYLGELSNPSLQTTIQAPDDKDQLRNSKGEDFMSKLHIDGLQNVYDLLDVVHAAEQRQAEVDAQLYKEAHKRLKHAFQQELKDAQAKEVMYAEEISRLAKEVELEKERAAATLESEQKMARKRLSEELKHKEEESDLKLKKAELLSKTELAAAVAKEKLAYIDDVRNVKQELEALYMVLFTQSKDFRLSHTIHKLAMGTFALEDAMKKGAPLEKGITLICSAYKSAGSDPLLEAIISSLPTQAVKNGTYTPYQLQEKFESLKKGVLELSLIPATGGGLISHAAAKIVSTLKVKESGQFSAGVAATVSQVQQCLADGKLVEAADILEKSVLGTKAEILVADWIEGVRERAIMEQMLLLLQAHATAAASTLA